MTKNKKFLIISGAPNKGKTTLINGIAYRLTKVLGGKLVLKGVLPNFHIDPIERIFHDFSIVILLNDKKIIIHSATDDKHNIDALEELIKQHPDTEIVITSCRDLEWERDYFYDKIIATYSTFHLEVPRALINRQNEFNLAVNWYDTESLKLCLHLLDNNPFNL